MLKSAAILAILLFAALNIVICFFSQTQDPDGAATAIRQFNRSGAFPKIVFIGSSLSKHVYNGLSENECRHYKITSLAFNLQLPSDSFLLIQEHLQGYHKPERIIMAVSPRDFFDNDALPIYRTVTFKRLVPWWFGIQNLPLYAPEFSDSLYALSERICPLFSYRLGAKMRLMESLKNICNGNSIDYRQPECSAEQAWKQSLSEYQWRYQGINLQRMSLQLTFFQRVLELCKQNHIDVQVVNLPLSVDNLHLLPVGMEQLFSTRLRQICQRNSVKFIDAANNLHMTDEDFVDCAHLNKIGARKVLNLLFEQNSNDGSSLSISSLLPAK